MDFSLQGPTQVTLFLQDLFGKFYGKLQAIMINFRSDVIEVFTVSNNYGETKRLVDVPMTFGYLNSSTFHGFRVKTKCYRRYTIFRLIDLHEIRPSSTGDDLWAHNFGERLLLTRIFFRSLTAEEGTVLIDCVPSYDKCAGENPCQNGGTCVANACKCKPAFMGEDCSRNRCPRGICKNGKT